jgi:CheY-like chemotaxis protein
MSYVLVVDDEQPIRTILRRQLIGWGYNVRTASNSNDALELMFAEPATIALIDIRMPGKDGLWLTERIREKWPKTSVIIATGVDDIEIVETSKDLGVVDYVRKPFERELLRQALGRAVRALGED